VRQQEKPTIRVATAEVSSPLFDQQQAAAYLNTTERHIRILWQERRITAVKIGRRVRFTKEDLDAYIDRNRHQAIR